MDIDKDKIIYFMDGKEYSFSIKDLQKNGEFYEQRHLEIMKLSFQEIATKAPDWINSLDKLDFSNR